MLYLDYFINNLETNDKSENTIINYRLDLERFYNYITSLEQFKGLEDVDVYNKIKLLDLEKYVAYLKSNGGRYGSGESSATIVRRIAALKTFFKYIHKHEIIEKNVAIGLAGVKIKKSKPVYLTEEESVGLVKAAKKEHFGERMGEYKKIRNELMIRIYIQYGLRNSELINLKLDDVDPETRRIGIIGKGRKYRTVYMSENNALLYREYLEIRNTLIKVKDDNVFLSNNGRKLDVSNVGRIIKSCIEDANISEDKKNKITPHKLRHTAATSMFNKGLQINEISRILGHESVEITDKIYVHLSEDNIKKNCEKISF